MLLQCAVFAGVPAANTAFKEARKLVDEMKAPAKAQKKAAGRKAPPRKSKK